MSAGVCGGGGGGGGGRGCLSLECSLLTCLINSCSFIEHRSIITPSVNNSTNLSTFLLHHRWGTILTLCSQNFIAFAFVLSCIDFLKFVWPHSPYKARDPLLYFYFLSSSFLFATGHREFSPSILTSPHSRSTQHFRLWTCYFISVSHLVLGSLKPFWLNFILKWIFLCHSISVVISWPSLSSGL